MLLAGVLSAGSLTFACAAPAYADEVSDAQNALSAAEARMSQIASEHEALVKQAEELQQQIDEATQGVMDAQAAAQTGRNKLGIYATQEYKTGGISLIKVLLESQSISDLVNNMQYFDAIQEDQARQIAEQKQLEATLNDALDDLNKKKDEQVKAISDAEAKQTEAQQVVAQATAHLSDAQAAAEAARLAELQKQAEALKAQQEAQSQTEQAPAEESKGAAEKAEDVKEAVEDAAEAARRADRATRTVQARTTPIPRIRAPRVGSLALFPPTAQRAMARWAPTPRRAQSSAKALWAWLFLCLCPTTDPILGARSKSAMVAARLSLW